MKFSAKSEKRIFGQNLAPKSQNLTLDHNFDPENGKLVQSDLTSEFLELKAFLVNFSAKLEEKLGP